MSRIALVTGGASGIGAETCRALAEGGYTLAVCDVNLDGAISVSEQLPNSGHRAYQVDVSEEQSVIDLFQDAESRQGAITVLACIAGIAVITPGVRPKLTTTTLEDWTKIEAINSRSMFLCMREYLRKREVANVEDGRIVLMSSTAAFQGTSPTGPAYSASKAAVVALTRWAAIEAAPFGITVNAVAPGTVSTPAFASALNADQIELIAKGNPLGRIGTPREVADVVAFLASPASSFMTGSVVHVNGGRVMV